MSHLLLTGATGMLGHFLMRDALLNDVPLAVLARSTGSMSGKERIEGHLQRWERNLGHTLPRPIVLEGDLLEPNLGLETDRISWVRDHCTRVIHSAASVTFDLAEKNGEPYRSNVDGTRQLLSLCEDLGIGEFHHISTAYVCGNQTGPVREDDFDVGQSCANDYERSKRKAEELVRRSELLGRPTIYRPSIIVGDSQTGYSTAFHGVYAALRLGLLYLLAKRDDLSSTSDGEIQWMDPGQFLSLLGLDGNERKNFVPVEWVSAAILKIVLRSECHGRTYHLTNPNVVPVGALKETMAKAVVSHLRTAQTPARAIPPNYINDDGYQEFMSVYRSYFRDDPEFDTANTTWAIPELPCPRLNDESLVRLWQYALDTEFSNYCARPEQPVRDFSEHFSQLPQWTPNAVDDEVVFLQITGPGGGNWTFTFSNGHPTGFRAGARPVVCLALYMNSKTASAIADRRLDIEQAIYAGRLVVEGNAQALAVAVSRLGSLFQLFDQLKRAESVSRRMVISN